MNDWQVELYLKYKKNYESDKYFLHMIGNTIFVCKKKKINITKRYTSVEAIFMAHGSFYEMREQFMEYMMWKYGFKLKGDKYMKNLIEEIEKLKDYSIEDSALDLVIREITNETIDKVLSILNQYNIITAPKSIKLSEVIDKIYKTEYSSECYVHAIKCDNGQYKDDYRIRVQYGDGYWGDYEFYIVDGKISSAFDMDLPRDEFKWLYTLLIAGTEIVDDLKEVEENGKV